MSPTHRTDDKWHWAIGASVVLVLAAVAGIVLLHIIRPGEDHGSVTTLLLGLTSTTVVALLALLKSMDNARELERNSANTEDTARTVSELANGAMDSKIRLAVAEVLAPHLVDPGVRPQLEVDEHKRDELDTLQQQLRARLDE